MVRAIDCLSTSPAGWSHPRSPRKGQDWAILTSIRSFFPPSPVSGRWAPSGQAIAAQHPAPHRKSFLTTQSPHLISRSCSFQAGSCSHARPCPGCEGQGPCLLPVLPFTTGGSWVQKRDSVVLMWFFRTASPFIPRLTLSAPLKAGRMAERWHVYACVCRFLCGRHVPGKQLTGQAWPAVVQAEYSLPTPALKYL